MMGFAYQSNPLTVYSVDSDYGLHHIVGHRSIFIKVKQNSLVTIRGEHDILFYIVRADT